MNRETSAQERYSRLIGMLRGAGSVLVAFSGGVDSTLLLHAATEGLGKRVLAVTVAAPYVSEQEVAAARNLAVSLGIRHRIVEIPFPKALRMNPPDRCYICKKIIFSRLLEIARTEGINTVIEGTNASDLDEDRPGIKALKELGIFSPFVTAGLDKTDIRNLSHALNLPTWNKPSLPCLMTRIPFGSRVDRDLLARIEQAETFLAKMGFSGVRVRTHGDLARIEVERDRINELIRPETAQAIETRLKTLGYDHVCVDLAGYRTGSMNTAPRGNRQERP